MTRRRITVCTAAALLTLTGCGGTSDADGDADSDKTPTTSSAPVESDSEPTAEASLSEPLATCTLKGKQRAKVTLYDNGDALVVTFDGQPVPSQGTVLYSVTAFDEAGEVGVQLGMKYEAGEVVGYFVFDFDTAQQTNLDGSPEVSGKVIRGTFPADALGELDDVGGVASWSADFNRNGEDVGTCPGGVESLPFPG